MQLDQQKAVYAVTFLQHYADMAILF